jgi:16S rRNA A1518/A1519 N6-dimethyltransferase RsmA/KsgA/DIM1 with predicted DNA glycosylase/AP lyase activity
MNDQDWQKLDNIKNDLADVRFSVKRDRDVEEVVKEYFEERKKTYRNTYLSHFYRQNQEVYEQIIPYKINTLWNKELKKEHEKVKMLESRLIECES